MAKRSVSRRRVLADVLPTDGVVVNAALSQVNPIDAINQATCMLEHLAEGLGFDAEGRESNRTFGQYVLYSTIAKQLRVAVDRLIDASCHQGGGSNA